MSIFTGNQKFNSYWEIFRFPVETIHYTIYIQLMRHTNIYIRNYYVYYDEILLFLIVHLWIKLRVVVGKWFLLCLYIIQICIVRDYIIFSVFVSNYVIFLLRSIATNFTLVFVNESVQKILYIYLYLLEYPGFSCWK